MDYYGLLSGANVVNLLLDRKISDFIKVFSDKNTLKILSNLPPRVEKDFQVQAAGILAYENNVLSFGDKKITRITETQQQFLEIVFRHEAGSNMPTIDFEKAMYGKSLDKKSQENMKKFTIRFNQKVEDKLGVPFVTYGTNFIYREN